MAGEDEELTPEQTEKLLQFQVIVAATSMSKHQKWKDTTNITVKMFNLWQRDEVVYRIEATYLLSLQNFVELQHAMSSVMRWIAPS